MAYIGLMDCNNFFVSCERVFRPDLRRKPVAVLSSNDACIIARSEEVKELGISMGVPYFQVRDVCKSEHITLFSSNFALYTDLSKRVMDVLAEHCAVYEQYSIDEAFFVVPENVPVKEFMHNLRTAVLSSTGIPVSVGVASTKTIAKYAATQAKKLDGVCFLGPEWQSAQSSVSCGSVWGVGFQTASKLRGQHINTVADLLQRNIGEIRDLLGVVGERLYFELGGTSVDAVENTSVDDEHKTLTSSRSFARPVTQETLLRNAVGYHVIRLAEKMRAQDVVAKSIRIVLRPHRATKEESSASHASYVFQTGSDDTFTLLQVARTLIDGFYVKGVAYKKASVSVSVVSREGETGELFATTQQNRSTLLASIDLLNKKYGTDSVHPGVVKKEGAALNIAKLLSPAYTTNWDDLRTVKAM